MILRLLARGRTSRRTAIPARTVETPRRSSVNLFKGHTTRAAGYRRDSGREPQPRRPESLTQFVSSSSTALGPAPGPAPDRVVGVAA